MITFTSTPDSTTDLMFPVNELLPCPRSGFPPGFTWITDAGVAFPPTVPDLKIDFGLFKPRHGEEFAETHASESVWVLMRGRAEVEFAGRRIELGRADVFNEPPSALHLGPETPFAVRTRAPDTEWAIVRTANERHFAPRLYLPVDLTPEYRGAGLVQNACLRNVRLIFDRTTRPESN